MKWYLEVMRKYAVFDGRARRKEYWMFVLFNMLVAIGIGFVLGFVGGILGIGTTLSSPASVLYGLGVLVPSLAVAVRRMHDTGRSGWWILIPFANLVFLCIEGQAGENQYGPNPKAA
jgi:uncharacterized membrane protein YhaH (DUF805 family)